MESNVGADSPPMRSTILGSFLRGRPRNSSQSHINTDPLRELSPSPPGQQQPPSPITGHRRRPPAATSAVPIQQSASAQGLGLGQMLRRRRSAGNITVNPTIAPSAFGVPASVPTAITRSPPPPGSTSHRIRLVPQLDSRRSLRFEPITRDLKEGDPPLRIGRFTDRSGGLAAVNALGSNKLAFKSKVVSRAHAEIWVESGGRFYLKDSKSSSGTFLNHSRLSPANTESRPFQIKDGDTVQLGVDYQGGTEDIYKSVKIRIEVGREWQSTANAFNTNAMKNLKALAVTVTASKSTGSAKAVKTPASVIPDCCICLFAVTIRQALFIAPCSHTFHYKCIRPLLDSHHPAFSCPLCRTFADLDEDVEVDQDPMDDDEDSAVEEAIAASTAAIIDRGAETEVENDAALVPSTLRPAPQQMELMSEEDEDEEMVDVNLRHDTDIVIVDASPSGSDEEAGGAHMADEGGEVGSKRKR